MNVASSSSSSSVLSTSFSSSSPRPFLPPSNGSSADTGFLVTVVVLVAVTTFTSTVVGKYFVDRFLPLPPPTVDRGVSGRSGSRARSSRRVFYSLGAMEGAGAPRRGAAASALRAAHVVEQGTFGRLGIDLGDDHIGPMAQRLEDQHLSPMQQTPPFGNNFGQQNNLDGLDSVFFGGNGHNNAFSMGAPMGRLELKSVTAATSASSMPATSTSVKVSKTNLDMNQECNNNNNNNNNVCLPSAVDKRPLLSSVESQPNQQRQEGGEEEGEAEDGDVRQQVGRLGAPGNTSPFVNKGHQQVTPRVVVDVYKDGQEEMTNSKKKLDNSLSRRMSAPVKHQSELVFASFANLLYRDNYCPNCGHKIERQDASRLTENDDE